ncbi:hypothetical protein BGZ65_005935, partial [Modicella reniformis]
NLELAQTTWLKSSRGVTRGTSSYDEGLEVAQVTVHTEFPVDKWFYIKSKASNFVLDVEHGFFRDHTKPGAILELNGQKLHASAKKHALLELQLWRFEDGFIINRRTGLALDAADGSLKPGTRLIQWTRKSTDNDNQQWAVTDGFIHLKSNAGLVLDVDGDGTRDGARIALNEHKDKKNLDQRWTFEAVTFSWLKRERSIGAEGDLELLKEFEASNLARVVDHRTPPVDCWFYLRSGISDLVLEVEHGREISHLKSGTHIQLAHQKLKSGKHSHALLELQLWRFQDGYFINRRSGLVLAVDSIEANAKLIQTTLTNSPNQRWVIEDGVIRLAARKEFALFLSYGRLGSRAFIRQVRQGETIQKWSFGEVHFSWLTLERIETEPLEGEFDTTKEITEITYLKKEKAQIRKLDKFSSACYFFLRTSNGYVIDIEHGFGKNHMKVGAYATIHPQTTAASANQHAILDIQLWMHKDGYLINKRTGLALTIERDVKEGARLIQGLPKDSIKWSIENGIIFPEQHTHLALNVRDGQVILVERTTATTLSIYGVGLSWLVFKPEVILLEFEQSEDYQFYEEFEEIVLRSSATANELIEYAKTEQYLVAPQEAWFYLVAGNKVASIDATYLLDHDAAGATIELVVQKRFSSAERHALVDLQLWKLEGSYLINRFTGHYLTVADNDTLILDGKHSDASRQQWQFSEDGSLSLISNSSKVVDFVNDKAVLVERSNGKTVWLYDAVKFSWLTGLETEATYDISAQLEGPFDNVEDATRAFQDIFKSKIGVEWTQRETATTSGGTWTTVEFEYDVVTIEDDSSSKHTHDLSQSASQPLVDAICPISKHATIYKDADNYHVTLTQKSTGVIYVAQLLYNIDTQTYYVYLRWGDSDYTLDGPYETVDIAKQQFQKKYVEIFGVSWEERNVQNVEWQTVQHTFETTDDYVTYESSDDEDQEEDTRTKDSGLILKESVTKDNAGVIITEITKTTLVATKPALSEKTSWFRKAAGAAAGAAMGAVALSQIDGVWKCKQKVVNTRKTPVDQAFPNAEKSIVYFDVDESEEVYEAILVDKATNVKHVTQLIFDTEDQAYYVYYRYGETNYTIDGPHDTLESAKIAFQDNYKETFEVEWKERKTAPSDKWAY